jgi:hypothetical protein
MENLLDIAKLRDQRPHMALEDRSAIARLAKNARARCLGSAPS